MSSKRIRVRQSAIDRPSGRARMDKPIVAPEWEWSRTRKHSRKPGAKKYDCLCAGIIVADFICSPITHVPDAGGLVMADSISPAIGGCASNVAVDLAGIGRKAAVVGRVGSDMPGLFARNELSAGGVDIAHLHAAPAAQTSSTLVINVRYQDRRFIHAAGANAAFDGSEIGPDLVRESEVLYVGGFFLMPRLTADRVVE